MGDPDLGHHSQFKVDKKDEVHKGKAGDGVLDADEAQQAAMESLAAMEEHLAREEEHN